MQAILGAGGAIGTELVKEFALAGQTVRLVSRNPKPIQLVSVPTTYFDPLTPAGHSATSAGWERNPVATTGKGAKPTRMRATVARILQEPEE